MRCLAALLGVLLAASPTATAQPVTWEPVPLTSADVRALTVLPDGDIYVASRGGLQRSFDGGESWSHWLTTSDVTGVAYSIDNVLFRGSEGLCRNENDTWFACGRVTAWEDIGSGSLAFGGSVGNAADAGSRLAGIVAAPDGRGWAAIGNDVWSYRGWGPHWEPSELPVDAILHLHRGASGRLFAATTDGLFSWDPDAEGSTWSRLGLAGRTLTSAFEGPNGDVFAGSVAGSVYQLIAGTPDGGGTAIASTAVLSLYAIGSATRDGPITVLAGTAGEGLFRSTDDGATWVSVLDADDIVPALGGNAVTTWAAVSHDGLRRSDDGGATWQPVRWNDLRAEHVEAGPDGLVVAGDDGAYGLFVYARSTDTWRPAGLSRTADHPSRTISDVAAAPDGRLYAAALDFVGDARRSLLYRSTDGGTTWETAHTFPLRGSLGTEGFVETLAVGPGGVLVAGTGAAAEGDADPIALLYRSDDGGTTWEETATVDAYRVSALTFGPDGTVYAGVGFDAPDVYRSDDGGRTWTPLGPVATGGSIQSVLGLAATETGALIAALNAEGTYRSTDRGATWERVIDRGHWTVTAYGNGRVLAGSTGVRRSEDGGRTWEEAGLDVSFVRDVAVDALGMAYAASSSEGLFRTVGSIVAAETEAPPSVTALSAYPNPFARTTTLLVTLDAPREVDITVHDVLGRRVAVLHRGTLTAGEHAVTFDRGPLPSGVYFVRATGEGLALSRRVLVVR